MSTMKFIRALRIVLGIAAIVCALPTIYAGVSLLWDWVRISGGQDVYVGSALSDYLGRGLLLTLSACVALIVSAYVTVRPPDRLGLLTFACAFAFGGVLMTFVVRVQDLPLQVASGEAAMRLGNVQSALYDWAREHGHFPTTELEFRTAVSGVDHASPFKRGGATIPYNFVYIANATADAKRQPPPQEPAIIVCAFSSDGRNAWVRTTTLEKPVGGKTVWLKIFGHPMDYDLYLVDRWYRPPS